MKTIQKVMIVLVIVYLLVLLCIAGLQNIKLIEENNKLKDEVHYLNSISLAEAELITNLSKNCKK